MPKTAKSRSTVKKCSSIRSMHQSLGSSAIAKLAFQKYQDHIAAQVLSYDSLQSVRLQPSYALFVSEAEADIGRVQPNYRQSDRAKLRRYLKLHRIGPFLSETLADKTPIQLPSWLGSVRLHRTVEGVIEDFIRSCSSLSARGIWALLPRHLAERGVEARLEEHSTRIRLDSIIWKIEAEGGRKTFGQFEKIYARARKPEPTLSG